MAEDQVPESAVTRRTAQAVGVAEDVIYALIAVLLVAAALLLLGEAVHELATQVPKDLREGIEHSLDSLLVVFILVELLAALRSVMTERRLVGEPFLLVGIITAIREIVLVASFQAKEGDVRDAMIEIGVLAGVVLAFSLATFMLRRRHREPHE